YITYYNAVQHTYNKIKRKFDIKKALHKRHLEYLRFYNCRTTGLWFQEAGGENSMKHFHFSRNEKNGKIYMKSLAKIIK
ncbi:hypothetical protein MKC93_15405, partial [[Clostridium] innocuum]|nr:hypothetical protein [[Clostridium] innocuum]